MGKLTAFVQDPQTEGIRDRHYAAGVKVPSHFNKDGDGLDAHDDRQALLARCDQLYSAFKEMGRLVREAVTEVGE